MSDESLDANEKAALLYRCRALVRLPAGADYLECERSSTYP
jgi:hypothetical protein